MPSVMDTAHVVKKLLKGAVTREAVRSTVYLALGNNEKQKKIWVFSFSFEKATVGEILLVIIVCVLVKPLEMLQH